MRFRDVLRTMLRAASAPPVYSDTSNAAPGRPHHGRRGVGPDAIVPVPWLRMRDSRFLEPSRPRLSHGRHARRHRNPTAELTARLAYTASWEGRFIVPTPKPRIVVPAPAEAERIAFKSPHKE